MNTPPLTLDLPPYVPPPKRRAKLVVIELNGEQVEVTAHHVPALQAGAECRRCPLYRFEGIGPVLGDIVPNAVAALVGEAPGKTEIEQGQVFVGASGRVLDDCIADAGARRRDLTITNTLLCMPPGGNLPAYIARLKFEHDVKVEKYEAAVARGEAADPPPVLVLPTEACFPRLARDLDVSASKTLIPVGGEGLRAVAKYTGTPYGPQRVAPGTPKLYSIKKQHGSPLVLRDGRTVFPSLHPAFGMQGSPTYAPVIRDDLTRAIRTATQGGRIEWVEPPFYLNPTEDVAVNILDTFVQHRAFVENDIETTSANPRTARLRCVGSGAVIGGRELVIVTPFEHMNGAPWGWTPAARERIANVLRKMLDENPLGFQNGTFDTDVLIRLGLMTNRQKTWFDDLHAHRNTRQSELPHDLGFMAARKFIVPRWKEDADSKNVDGVDDLTEHAYCARDVLGQLRLVPVLAREVVQDGMIDSFRTDTDLLPCARDMGVLGMNVNEDVRRKFYYQLSQAGDQHLANLRRLTNKPDYNPNSTRQLARFLYIEKGLTPLYDTTGEAWADRNKGDEGLDGEDAEVDPETAASELERASTSELALLGLLDKGVDAHTQEFIEEQIRYRSMRKIIGTYLGYRFDETENFVHDTFRERGIITEEPYEGQTLSILHPTWNPGPPTGRWRARRPGAQTFPERVVYDPALYRSTDGEEGLVNTRAMIEAVPGHVLVGADLSKVELKIYMVLAQDKLLLEADDRGLDDHSWNYANMMGRTDAEVWAWYNLLEKPNPSKAEKTARKQARNTAKRFAYLILYGGQEEKLYQTMATDRNPDGSRMFPDLRPETVHYWFVNWHTKHPETRWWQQNVISAWQETGYVASFFDGRKRYFLGGLDPNAICNFPIQSTAADITNRAMKQIMQVCPQFGWSPWSGPFAQVHDYIGLQVPEHRAQEAAELLRTTMTAEIHGRKITNEVSIAGRVLKDKKTGAIRVVRPSWDRT